MYFMNVMKEIHEGLVAPDRNEMRGANDRLDTLVRCGTHVRYARNALHNVPERAATHNTRVGLVRREQTAGSDEGNVRTSFETASY